METVKAIVTIPGLLEKGDILTSAGMGEDFVTGEIIRNENGNTVSRSATVDYYSVCAYIPTHFDWVIEDEDLFVVNKAKEFALIDEYNEDLDLAEGMYIYRTFDELVERGKFFKEKIAKSTNWEETVVYNNLLWFIDWLLGKRELLK